MIKKLIYFMLALLCLAAGYGIQRWSVSLSFEGFQPQSKQLLTEKTTFSCPAPSDLGVKSVKTDEAVIYWDDSSGSTWEYYVVPYGDPTPSTFTTTTNKEELITQDQNGNTLQPDTQYEFYVRTDCGTEGTSSWEGPFDFKTLCTAFTVPFSEGFNTTSTTFDCWTITDNNKDAVSPTGNNIWKQHTATPYEGDRVMYFKGDSGKNHDDWLISPAITLTGGIYAISYYYKTSALASDENEFEVLLSENGIDTDQFTTVLLPRHIYKQGSYQKKIVYVQGITADVHLGWHITSSKSTEVYLDMLSVEAVDCVGLDLEDIELTDLKTDEVTFKWTDDNNAQWEYYVQPINGGIPTGSGTLTTQKEETITRITGGGNLQPDTEYEFWIRTDCGSGKKSQWIGPVVFRTPCAILPLPFWEGFNSNSTTIDCWRIMNQNGLERLAQGWIQTDDNPFCYEGDRGMITYHLYPGKFNDWLISPTFLLDNTKIYKLEYYVSQFSAHMVDVMEVYLSQNNINLDIDAFIKLDDSDFRTPLANKINAENPNFKKQTIYIKDTGGEVNLAWKRAAITLGGSVMALDHVTLEEVTCAGPIKLYAREEKEDQAIIYCEDDINTEWEYVVQKRGNKGVPMGNGVKTTTKENSITQEFNGDLLEPDTDYEYYVRAKCIQGQGSVESWSAWEGPMHFRTTCTNMTLPFWEGFNVDSPTISCWIADVSLPPGSGVGLYTTMNSPIEGNRSVEIHQDSRLPKVEQQWLISPTFTLDVHKKYRLRYYSKSTAIDFEVLASNSGVDRSNFTTVLLSEPDYRQNNWTKEEIIISDLGGEVNFAWRIMSKNQGNTTFNLDDVYIEELNCLHPEDLKAEDIKEDEVTLAWDEDTNSEWEYIVQKEGKGRPVSSGTSTTTYENIISTDSDGEDLEPDTEYEFYVRVNCGSGTYSEWAGPHLFKTAPACKDGFDTPFWEGFNSDSQTVGCWTYIDNGASVSLLPIGTSWINRSTMLAGNIEGDGIAAYYKIDVGGTQQQEGWLISPTIKLDGGKYLLKYRYATLNALGSITFDNPFEVLLSENGTAIDQFTTILHPTDSYTNTDWQEQLIEIDGINGDINLAWHITAVGSTLIGIDSVSLEKVRDCPEPYGVEIINETPGGIDITWQQDGGSSEWEIIVVDYGEDETATPVQTVKVTGNPEATLSGLDPNKEYTIYIRSICSEKDIKSEWSSAIHKIPVQTNVDCAHAKTLPVNPGPDWDKYVYGSFVGATLPGMDVSGCNRFQDTSKDIWFEFTATETVHVLKVLNIPSDGMTNRMYGAIYTQNCGAIRGNDALECFEITNENNNDFRIFRDLTPGNTYYIRFEHSEQYTRSLLSFDLSITSPSIEFSASGDLYSVEELVEEVFMRSESDCEQISDIEYIMADGGSTSGMVPLNTIGYFKNTKGKEVFPFKEGIVLSNATIDINTFGTYEPAVKSSADKARNYDIDSDLLNLYNGLNGRNPAVVNQAILEFDFIPLTDSLQWEYIFASDCFNGNHCTTGTPHTMGLVGSWIIDKATEERTNVALTPQTEQSVGAIHIIDKELSNCSFNINPDLVGWINNTNDTNYDKRKSPINFGGMTVPLQTKKAAVIPGHKYRIKIAVADRCTNTHQSAVFLNAASFNNAGDVDLGPDWLVETNNALCYNQTAIISSQTDISDVIEKEYAWYKDDVLISGANTPDLAVSEAGEYKVVMQLTELNCEFTDTIVVEVYPPISEVVYQAETIEVCLYSLQETIVDLTVVETAMFAAVDRSMYTTSYYNTTADAEAAKNAIANAANYSLGKEPQARNLYIRVENTETGCYEVFVLPIQPEEGAVPDKPSDVIVCAEYVFPKTAGNQYYYTESGGQGTVYQAGDVLAESGEHTIYLLQVNSAEGCYEETAYQVNITAPVTADVFEDKTLSCEYYQLVPLSEHNRYYTEPEQQGNELYAGMQILYKQIVYVYASSEDGLCTDESSFVIDYEDCPIPRGISPNNDGLNDIFDLTPHGVESIKIYNRWGTEVYTHGEGYTTQWHGQNKSGKQLPDGTYYYVIHAHGKIRTGWVQINK